MLLNLVTFAPDADPAAVGVLLDATGIIPVERGIKAAPTAADAGIDTLAAACIGAATVERVDSSKTLYAGTAVALYSTSGTTWAVVTRSASAYAAPAASTWYFATFGNQALAANSGTVMQVSTGGLFSDISGAPRAEIVEVAGLFALAFNTSDGSSWDYRDGWWTSAQSNVTDWTPAIATGSVRGRFYQTPGPIRAAKALGEQCVAYKSTGVYLGTNGGPPQWWTWQLVPGDAGCVGKFAVCNIVKDGAPAHFIVGPRSMYVFDGTRPVPIGDGLVTRWFYQKLNPTYRDKTACVVDKAAGAVYVLFANSESTGSLNDCLIYSYRTNKWGRGRNYAAAFGLQYITPSATYDNVPATGATYDNISGASYDELFTDAEMEGPAIITTGNKVATINGAAATSSYRTGYFGTDGSVSLMRRVRPRHFTEPSAASLTLFVSDSIGDPTTLWSTSDFTDNRFDMLAEARWHQLEITNTGPFELSGLDIELIPASAE